MLKQKTLKQEVRATGVGLHSGDKVEIILRPAAADHGVVFRRVDLPHPVEMRVQPDLVKDTRLCSALEQDGARVATVEHLMSALAGLGVDNVLIDINAGEVPIMDGSASPFVFLLQSAGIVEQNAPKKFIRILKTVEYQDKDKWVKFEPYDGFKLDFKIDFNHPAFEHGTKHVVIDFASGDYIREISRARTFGFMHEVEYMRDNNLARGGSLDNAIVLDEYKVLNPEGLRFNDEFVKHKILDAIGDLYMIGHPIIGHYQAYKSGHAMNNQLLRNILADASSYEIVSFPQKELAPAAFTRPAATSPGALNYAR